MKNSTTTRCGFTLLELLLAMTISAVIVAMSLALLRSGLLAERVAGEVGKWNFSARAAADAIASPLESARISGSLLAGEFIGCDELSSDYEDMSFYCAASYMASDTFGSDIIKVAFALEASSSGTDDGGNSKLLVKYTWRNLLSTRSLDGERQIISRDVESVALSYFDGDSWHDSWKSTEQNDTLPEAVRISVTLRSDLAGNGDDESENDDKPAFEKIVFLHAANTANTGGSEQEQSQ